MIHVKSCLLALVVSAGSACTAGLDQSFDVTPGPGVTNSSNDMWFELTNRGGNAPEALSVYRVVLGPTAEAGGLFAHDDQGDAMLELEVDGGTEGVVDSGDVVRVHEYADGKNLTAADNGRTLWINVMVLEPDQRSSDALTRTWGTVWSTQWTVGGIQP